MTFDCPIESAAWIWNREDANRNSATSSARSGVTTSARARLVGNDERKTLTGFHRRGLIMTVMVAALLAVSGLAVAAPDMQHPADADFVADESPAVVEYEYVEDQGLLVYWLPGEEAPDDEPVDCAAALLDVDPDEDVDPVEGEVAELPELPGGCYGVDVTGPNGQINHGTIMSAFVRSLKGIDFEGPRGQAVRELAHSDLGKGDQKVKTGDDDEFGDPSDDDDNDEDEAELDDGEKTNGPPAHANANGRKDKKPKKPKKNK